MIKVTIILFLLCSITFSQKINLNYADSNDLSILNISKEKIEYIIKYREKYGFFSSIYDLLQISTITIEDIHSIRDEITLEVIQKSEFEKDMQRAAYKLGQWISNEGSTEGLSEIWLDRFFEPKNINNMSYDDLMSLPNLSTIDVIAVLKQKERGYINGKFELKNSPGISYWGYKNLVDFVRFENKPINEQKYHIRLNLLTRTIPITSNPDDEGTITAFKNSSQPEQFHKLSIISPHNIKAGFTYHRYMGQPDSIYTLKKFIQKDNLHIFNNFFIDRIILGNFTASFGQGVILETNDNFSPRKTGFGFTKRNEGIHGDLTRSSQYVMYGTAMQFSTEKLRSTIFTSYHPRDAIINNPNDADSLFVQNGDTINVQNSYTSMIVMQPRLPFGANQDTINIYHSLIGSINEMTWGVNLRFTPIIGTNIGFTFFESLYDRYHIPKIRQTITGGDSDYSGDDYYLAYITNSADAEIASMDTSIGTNGVNIPSWSDAKSFFRVRGFDFSTVIGNLSIQGEYGEMLKDNKLLNFGRSPSALVLSAYAQFENLNILTLYRNYDIAFDNPYQRSFSNYQRYKTTIFEDSYWLVDPIYSYLYSGNPQPQAEEGIYIYSRYQFHRSFVGYLNWDTWNRKADNAKYYRTVASIEWRPAFNFRIKLRQKWQARGAYDLQNPSPFYSRETRVQARLRMSKYNQFEILYSKGYTTFSPRPRLTDNALGGTMMVGNIGSPDETIGISISHHVSSSLSIKGGALYIQGFLWYFEDTDFRIFSTNNGSYHNWVSVDLKPSPLFRVMFKVSYSTDAPSTKIVDAQTPYKNWIQNPLLTTEEMDYRLQISYAI